MPEVLLLEASQAPQSVETRTAGRKAGECTVETLIRKLLMIRDPEKDAGGDRAEDD